MKRLFTHIIITVALFLIIASGLDLLYSTVYVNDKPRNKVQLVANLTNTQID